MITILFYLKYLLLFVLLFFVTLIILVVGNYILFLIF